MERSRVRQGGFTIIEMMVAVLAMLVLIAIAQPSFESLRQRSAIRGSAEHLLSFWNQARLEAAKRNQFVKVGVVQSNNGKTFCLGAATTTDPNDTTPCDCTQPAPSSDVCNVAIFPGENNNSQWRGVELTGMTLGGGTVITAIEPAVIEPKRTNLIVPDDDGSITISSPAGRWNYKVNLLVDRFGRGVLCESTSAVDRLSDYGTRRCAP
jgi:prepilin-type N-terminal cleavage/methylation domain-containing protein